MEKLFGSLLLIAPLLVMFGMVVDSLGLSDAILVIISSTSGASSIILGAYLITNKN